MIGYTYSRTEPCPCSRPVHVVGVVVTYFPEPDALEELLQQLVLQVAEIVVVDNGSDGAVSRLLAKQAWPNISILLQKDNIGVAAAVNRGVEEALRSGATHVLLSDQDSVPPPGMVRTLLAVCDWLDAQSMPFGAVGPQYFDPSSGYRSPFARTQGLWLSSVRETFPSPCVETDFLITSGSLISASAWKATGGMDESLFIDYVDIEWGLRARRIGYPCYGTFRTQMAHTLGDRRVSFFGLAIPVHGPIRHYYQIRNPILLYKRNTIPLNWKIVDAARLALRFVFYSTVTGPRIENLICMGRGVLDAFRGRSGKYEE